ncbi:ZrgA family zinc uptake protein [Henriciella aquimarina]|uniref:ZrgA family zinc uptake protein n=1 Tax=Henriciella aquimarina TaxID=545261 RepID=UPI00117B09BE|nr:DUF2796 domain-containing protein [Henriciella aquimarina]
MRLSRAFIAVAALGLMPVLAGCDRGEEAVTKDVTGPSGAVSPQAEAPEEAAESPAADTGETAGTQRLEAHEHGRASLAAAVDDDTLTITFEAPLVSLVGFEHAPENDEQQAAIDALKDAFFIPGDMVSVNAAAECLPLMTTSGTHFAHGHGGLEAEHVFTCEKPARIEQIEFLMLDTYPDLKVIEAVFLSDTTQAAGELTAAKPMLEVR